MDNEEYEVEEILNMKIIRGKRHFLIRWKGFNSEDEQTWEPEKNLNCKELLEEFLRKRTRERSRSRSRGRLSTRYPRASTPLKQNVQETVDEVIPIKRRSPRSLEKENNIFNSNQIPTMDELRALAEHRSREKIKNGGRTTVSNNYVETSKNGRRSRRNWITLMFVLLVSGVLFSLVFASLFPTVLEQQGSS